jgi:hypothetical protein
MSFSPASAGIIPVFYTPAMVAEAGSYSPSAAKPAAAMASWSQFDLPLQIIRPVSAPA